MTTPYKLTSRTPILPTHPLHWQYFWPDLQRVHRSKAEARQDLILWLANLYSGTVKPGMPIGFCTVQVQLTELRQWVRDYHIALDVFFDVQQLGFYVDVDNREITTLVPKKLPEPLASVVQVIPSELRYVVPPLPDNSVISKVYLQPNINPEALIQRTISAGRPELVPPLAWLLRQNYEINFHFIPSGKLKQRDTSIWPICAIETWPSWLRKELFGPGIDIDSAYVAFLMQHLQEEFRENPEQIKVLFPDLVQMLYNKNAFRQELCEKVLKRPYDSVWRSVIKSILMSIANGSRVSGNILVSGTEFSQTARLIQEAAPDVTISELLEIGNRLQLIARQFDSARKRLCNSKLQLNPTRKNLKAVFSEYFAWEREARYAIWENIGRHGIMVHDGIDGVPQIYLDRLSEISAKIGLQLTV
jgi:hypothetical protein